MTEVDLKKHKAELLRVQAATAEMEYVIAQRQEEIQRLEYNIQIQKETEAKLIKLMGESNNG